MTYRVYATLFAAVSAAALVLGASETFADPAGARGAGMAPQRPGFPSMPGRSMHPHRGAAGFWPGYGGVFYAPSNTADEPVVQAAPPKMSDDLRYTCVLDIPWDYVHRCPQFTTPR